MWYARICSIFLLTLCLAGTVHAENTSTAAEFFVNACEHREVADAVIALSRQELAAGVLFEFDGVRLCAVLIPLEEMRSSENAASLERACAERAAMKASSLLIRSLRNDAAKDLITFLRDGDERLARLIQTASSPVVEGAAAIAWRRLDDLR